jgi:DNA-binding XRE family transcriptional regulator
VGVVQAEAQGEAAEQRLTELRERCHVSQHHAAQLGHLGRPQVRTVQRRARAHARELGTEVESFLLIRTPRGELAAERKVAAPGASAERHADAQLHVARQREEASALRAELALQLGIDTVADGVEEAALRAGGGELSADRVAPRATRDQIAHVDDRDPRELAGVAHARLSARPRPAGAGARSRSGSRAGCGT